MTVDLEAGFVADLWCLGGGVVVDRSWLVEQRYGAVREVLDGAAVTEVALRFGVARQTVYDWLERFEAEGVAGLVERSRRPHHSPTRLPSDLEAMACEMRRAHPRWGARRICHEMLLAGIDPAPARATVHRALVRNGLVRPQEQRHRRRYRRWQRESPMQLWQLDLVGGVLLADGRECKVLSGIDDHARFVVSATVLAVPSGRAVAAAFTAAMDRYGVPQEVLTDNGKQFTGRFTKPRPAEVLFERVCREHGITARRTQPRSPTTTGKIERWHQTLRRELLDVTGPFANIAAAQAAIDAWVHTYNHERPHQSLDMATPASRFRPDRPLALPTPAGRLEAAHGGPANLPLPSDVRVGTAPTRSAVRHEAAEDAGAPVRADWSAAVELEVVVPGSGQVGVLPSVQRVNVGQWLAGRLVTFWVDQRSMHVLYQGQLVKTVPSKLKAEDLEHLHRRGARPAGPAPAPPAPRPLHSISPTTTLELERTVDANGYLDLAGDRLKVGTQLARRRVTLRLDGHLTHVIDDGILAKTLPCDLDDEQRQRLRGARPATTPLPPPPSPGPLSVTRVVARDGVIMVARQRLRVGATHTGKTVTVLVEDTYLRVLLHGEEISLHPRTTTNPITRFTAYKRS